MLVGSSRTGSRAAHGHKREQTVASGAGALIIQIPRKVTCFTNSFAFVNRSAIHVAFRTVICHLPSVDFDFQNDLRCTFSFEVQINLQTGADPGREDDDLEGER